LTIEQRDDWRTGQRCPRKKCRFWWRRSVASVDPDRVEFDPAHMARLARYRETPYHGLYSPRDHLSVVQWSAAEYTYHGDGANKRSVGWAYDGLFKPSHMDALDVEGGREGLRHMIRAALEQGCPLRQVSAHACHSRKMHDPGPRVWLEVVEPVAAEFGLEVAADWTTGVGQPWIKRWREAA
jgi:hypothetical protein